MDSYSSHSHTKPAITTSSNTHFHHQPASTSELMSSAKFMADAAKSALKHEGHENIDKGKVAGAAADLLGAAKHYGKLEEKSFGKYVDKAEGYLHKYHSSHSSATTSMHSTAAPGVGSTTYSSHSGHGSVDSSYIHEESQAHASGGGGKYGDYIKLAQGILKKH